MALGAVGLFAGAALVGLGCGSGPYFGPPSEGAGGSTGNGVFPSGTGAGEGCSEGAQQACHVTIGTQNGVTNCLNGVEVCSGGQWGPCSQGQLTPPSSAAHRGPIEQDEEAVLAPTFQGAQGTGVMALNAMLGSCSDHCDPTCHQFTENDPPGGGKGKGMGPCNWKESPSGALMAAMGSLMGQGYKEPCGAAWDCEFDQYCSNPVTQNMPGSCAHDKCATGAGLLGCNDPCVHAVLSNPLNVLCNLNWSNSCVQAVYDVCGLDCVNTTIGCAHDECITGGPLVDSCDNASPALSCVHQICNTAGTHHCCQLLGQWDQACVHAVATVCGPADACPMPAGTCQPWQAGMADPECTGHPDLTAGVVCNDGTQDVIPICNVGDTTANAPITVYRHARGMGTAPAYPPNTTYTSTCMVTTSIPAGACVDVPCPGTNNNDELFVNPPGGSQIAECNYLNNWGIRIGGGMPPMCSDPGTCSPGMDPVPPITYTGDCSTWPGTSVQWRWLTYDTHDPGHSSIDFMVQTGSMPMPMTVATADHTTQVCATGMGGGCPVNIVAAIGSGASFSDTIAVSAVLNSSMGPRPTIHQWKIEYSCVDSE